LNYDCVNEKKNTKIQDGLELDKVFVLLRKAIAMTFIGGKYQYNNLLSATILNAGKKLTTLGESQE